MKIQAVLFCSALVFTIAACGQPKEPVALSAEDARFEAQKIVLALKGRAGSAAFMDVVLKDDGKYREIFTNGLKMTIERAPQNDAAFAAYKPCIESGIALLKFAELRKISGGQNEESDRYRRPYWDSLHACEKAIGQQ